MPLTVPAVSVMRLCFGMMMAAVVAIVVAVRLSLGVAMPVIPALIAVVCLWRLVMVVAVALMRGPRHEG